MLDYTTKLMILGNKDLLKFAVKNKIDREKLKKCDIMRFGSIFFFILNDDNSSSDVHNTCPVKEICPMKSGLGNISDVVLLLYLKDDEDEAFFEKTDWTYRIMKDNG